MYHTDRMDWAHMVSRQICDRWLAKYIVGMKEHACDLGDVGVKELLDEMENEALDQLSYIYELKRRLKAAACSGSSGDDNDVGFKG